jgi:hypothetical protein
MSNLDDRLFWEAIYRCLVSIAAAIKKFKLSGYTVADKDDTMEVVRIQSGNRG